MSIIVNFEKKDGKLYITDKGELSRYEQFKHGLEDGQKIEAYFDILHDDGSLGQLAKLHAMIRDLAFQSGNTFQDMKLYVKDEAGLCITRSLKGKEFIECKSFGDCSRKELSLAIQACEDLRSKIEKSFLEF
jgi:hypothetical protein